MSTVTTDEALQTLRDKQDAIAALLQAATALNGNVCAPRMIDFLDAEQRVHDLDQQILSWRFPLKIRLRVWRNQRFGRR